MQVEEASMGGKYRRQVLEVSTGGNYCRQVLEAIGVGICFIKLAKHIK